MFEGREGTIDKTVHWFVASAPSGLEPKPGSGFAEARWCNPEDARALLVHASDRELAAKAVAATRGPQ
jgi:hypothetical protein